MALKDFQEYVASQGGGGAEQYVDPTTGKIKTEKTGGAISKTPTTPAKDTGFDFGAANNLGSNLKNPGAIAPGLGMVNKTTTDNGSAWSTAKEKTSMGIAIANPLSYTLTTTEWIVSDGQTPLMDLPFTSSAVNAQRVVEAGITMPSVSTSSGTTTIIFSAVRTPPVDVDVAVYNITEVSA